MNAKEYLSHIIKKTGLPPGSAVHIGTPGNTPATISLIQYSKDICTEKNDVTPEDAIIPPSDNLVHWVDIRGLQHVKSIETIGKTFNLHALITEDILNTTQFPKIEEQDDLFFVIMKNIRFENKTLQFEHICFVYAPHLLLTFQEHVTDTFGIVKQRIKNKIGKIATKETDYLLYALLDYIVDTYFETLQHIDERMTELNEMVEKTIAQDTLKQIHHLKKDIQTIKRYFWYTREIILHLKKSESPLITKDTMKYLNDLNDHILHIIDIAESFREELIDLTERHLSAINLRSNDIVKMLTIVTTIFMPLTFLAGIYGMNFRHMPELELKGAYPTLLGFMLIIALSLYAYFRKKKWFE